MFAQMLEQPLFAMHYAGHGLARTIDHHRRNIIRSEKELMRREELVCLYTGLWIVSKNLIPLSRVVRLN